MLPNDLTPEQVFEQHYHGLTNPATPVVIERGWLWKAQNAAVAYELMRSEDGSLFGVQAVQWSALNPPNEPTQELPPIRFAGKTEAAARAHIKMWQNKFN